MAELLPAGYLLKRVVPPPGWLATPQVEEVCSVTSCVNDDVVDVATPWLHNGFGLANDPDVLTGLVATMGATTAGARLFFYTAYDREMPSDGWSFDPADWRPRQPVPSAGVADAVVLPAAWPDLVTSGYDVVVRSDYLEHSPLSCNSMAETLPVNRHCLFDHLSDAVTAVENGTFHGCEPGIYTVYGVHPLGTAT